MEKDFMTILFQQFYGSCRYGMVKAFLVRVSKYYWHLFFPGINGRRDKSVYSVCFKMYCAGLSVESEQRKLQMTPTTV